VVTHPLWVKEVPGSIRSSGKGFYVLFFFVLLLLCFYFFVQKHIIFHKSLQFLLQCKFILYNDHIARFVTDFMGIKIQT